MKKQAFNPFLPPDAYIPDGEPHIFGDRVYLYGSHDREGGPTFCMEDYEVWSAPVDDLSDWRREGVIYRAAQDPDYAKRPYMYAPDVVRGFDGRYYLYYCMSGDFGRGGYHGPISVAVCDSPAGKYEYLGFVRNPDGSPMNRYVCFDPCAFRDDDGRIYLYYGTQYMRESLDELRADPALMSDVCGRYARNPEELLSYPDNINGPCVAELCEDMLTVKSGPKRIIPYEADFEGREFFEASSMRKVRGKYYFVYSSQLNHELCYAVSDRPDGDFVFGGTIVSNGDVGLEGVSSRMNMTGTTHGSIIEINGQWYVFYHRLTHKSDYSRQACAERITIEPDGSIKQVEVTSCGLNGGPLAGKGSYPATIACNIVDPNTPHGSNKIFEESFPNVNHADTPDGRERFVAEIGEGTLLGFKYFAFDGLQSVGLVCRGDFSGIAEILFGLGEEPAAVLDITPSGEWRSFSARVSVPDGTRPLYFVFKGEGRLSARDILLG